MKADAAKIRRALAEAKQRPADLARHAGISASHLANAMAGRRGLSPEVLERLAGVLCTPPEELCQRVGSSDAEPVLDAAVASGQPIVLDGRAVRYWRRHFGMTIAALADSAGVEPAWLSSVERSSRTKLPIGSDAAQRLAGALAVPLEELVAEPPG